MDPLEGEGGTKEVLEKRLQSFGDKLDRFLMIKALIHDKNLEVLVHAKSDEEGIEVDEKMCLKAWLDWERYVKPFQQKLWQGIKMVQKSAMHRLQGMPRPPEGEKEKSKIVFNVPVTQADKELAKIFTIESLLDGRKSVANATETIEIPDGTSP